MNDRQAYADAVHADDWLEAMCQEATRRLQLGLAISVGMHRANLRKRALAAKYRLTSRETPDTVRARTEQ